MNDRSLLRTGLIGTAVAALSCFTPFLVVILGGLGLSAASGSLDYDFLPVLAVFSGITIYALIRTRRS